jgi:hypothetical protein
MVDITPLLHGADGCGVPWLTGGRTLAGMDCWGPVDWIQRQLGRVPPPAPWDGDGADAFRSPIEPQVANALMSGVGAGRGWTWSQLADTAQLGIGDVVISLLDSGPHAACVYMERPCRVVTIFHSTALVQTHPIKAIRYHEAWRLVRTTSSPYPAPG